MLQRTSEAQRAFAHIWTHSRSADERAGVAEDSRPLLPMSRVCDGAAAGAPHTLGGVSGAATAPAYPPTSELWLARTG